MGDKKKSMSNSGVCSLFFENCVLIEDQIYFVGYHIAALFSMNLYTGKVKYIDRIPNEMIVQTHLVCTILTYKNYLILIPSRATNNFIWFYDLEKEIWSSISFEDKGIKAPYEQFEYAAIYENELFVVGCYYPAIVCIDLRDKKQTYYEIFENDFQLHSLGTCVNIENQLYIPSPISNHVIVFDMKSKGHKCLSVGNENNSYSGIAKKGEAFWLSPIKNTAVVKWDGRDGIVEYELPVEFQNESGYIFNGITLHKNKIYIYGLKEKLSFYFLDEQYKKYEIIKDSYLMFKRLNGDYLITCNYNGKIQVISEEGKKEYRLFLTETETAWIMKEWKKELQQVRNIKLTEDDFLTLDRFLTIV